MRAAFEIRSRFIKTSKLKQIRKINLLSSIIINRLSENTSRFWQKNGKKMKIFEKMGKKDRMAGARALKGPPERGAAGERWAFCPL
ncbi:MAG: hypothetical protein K6C40_00235 [Thermoguttaceae bacterium]|nr:hypothetical protein [Thermoguttaceae bacterium]